MMSFNDQATRIVILVTIGLLGVMANYKSLDAPFYFDDSSNIVENKSLHLESITPDSIKEIFSPYQQSPSRRFANITFAINYYFTKLNPVGFRAVNIFIHIINGWLIFALFRRYLNLASLLSPNELYAKKHILLSGIAALLWVTNPIQTNAVTYIVQRMTSLSVTFCLLSIIFYLRGRTSTSSTAENHSKAKKALNYTGSFCCFLLAVNCKEIAAIVPVLLLVHEIFFFFKNKKIPQKNIIFLAVGFSAFFLIVIYFFLGFNFIDRILASYSTRDFTLTERLLTQTRVVFHYMGLFLYPLADRFHLYYDTFPISKSFFSPITTVFSTLGIILWITAVFHFYKKNILIAFGLTGTLLTLLIESTIIPLELVFEHRFYFPSVFFSLTLVLILYTLASKYNISPKIIFLFFTIFITTNILGTISRNKVWKDELSFAMHEVQTNPGSVRALVNVGQLLINNKRPLAAKHYLHKALEINPDDIITLNNLVVLYSNPPFNNYTRTQQYIDRIIQLVLSEKNKPTDNQVLYTISHYLYLNQRYRDSLTLLHAIEKYLLFPDLLLNIGKCNIQTGNFVEAEKYLKKALQLEPANKTYQFSYALSIKDSHKLKAFNIVAKLMENPPEDKEEQESIKILYSELKADIFPQNS